MIADIADETPLRLADAVELAFPNGGMTVSGLRREAAKGRLAISIIAGKQFTTLRAIREMIETCRVGPKVPVLNSSAPRGAARRSGSSATVNTARARDAALASLSKLSRR
jgi:hypothetical protein